MSGHFWSLYEKRWIQSPSKRRFYLSPSISWRRRKGCQSQALPQWWSPLPQLLTSQQECQWLPPLEPRRALGASFLLQVDIVAPFNHLLNFQSALLWSLLVAGPGRNSFLVLMVHWRAPRSCYWPPQCRILLLQHHRLNRLRSKFYLWRPQLV